MTVGNMPVSAMANPKVQKSFESAISSASGGAPTKTTPKEECGEEENQYTLSYDTLIGEGNWAAGKKKGKKKGGVVKSLLTSVVSKAANLGIQLPPPVNLGMTVSVA